MPPASAPARSTCGLAIGSLVCGLLGFLTLITSIPAVILGHVSLSKIKASGGALGGRGMALAGLITGYMVIAIIPIAAIAGLVTPLILRQKATADRTQTIMNMKQLGLALLEFEQELGGYPNDGSADAVLKLTGSGISVSDLQGADVLRQLEAFGMNDSLDVLLQVPKSAEGDWFYFPPDDESLDPSMPLLVSPAIGRKRCVLRLANSVESITESELERLLMVHPKHIIVLPGSP